MTIDPLGLAARPDRSFVAQAPLQARVQAVPTAASSAAVPASEATPPLVGTVAASPESSGAPGATDPLEDAVSKLNASVPAQSLEFAIDEESKRTIVKVIDTETKEVVRQLPTKEALEIAKSLDKAFGVLIRQQA